VALIVAIPFHKATLTFDSHENDHELANESYKSQSIGFRTSVTMVTPKPSQHC